MDLIVPSRLEHLQKWNRGQPDPLLNILERIHALLQNRTAEDESVRMPVHTAAPDTKKIPSSSYPGGNLRGTGKYWSFSKRDPTGSEANPQC